MVYYAFKLQIGRNWNQVLSNLLNYWLLLRKVWGEGRIELLLASLSRVSAVHFHQRTCGHVKRSNSFFQFSRQKVCSEVNFIFCSGTFESKFLQKLESASVWPSFLPLQLSFLFTFVSQFVSLLVLPFWLCLAVWVLWHYLLPDPQGFPDWPQLSFFLCQEVYLYHHFWLHCPEIQTSVDVLSWVLKGQVVLIHLLSHLFFVEYSLHQLRLLFFSFLGHCWYCPGWSDQN